jgi:hypothetical protein
MLHVHSFRCEKHVQMNIRFHSKNSPSTPRTSVSCPENMVSKLSGAKVQITPWRKLGGRYSRLLQGAFVSLWILSLARADGCYLVDMAPQALLSSGVSAGGAGTTCFAGWLGGASTVGDGDLGFVTVGSVALEEQSGTG